MITNVSSTQCFQILGRWWNSVIALFSISFMARICDTGEYVGVPNIFLGI